METYHADKGAHADGLSRLQSSETVEYGYLAS